MIATALSWHRDGEDLTAQLGELLYRISPHRVKGSGNRRHGYDVSVARGEAVLRLGWEGSQKSAKVKAEVHNDPTAWGLPALPTRSRELWA